MAWNSYKEADLLFMIYDQEGREVGSADTESQQVEAIGEPLKSILAKYKRASPRMWGGEVEETFWDGFENIKADDDGYFEALTEALRWAGFRFEEIEPGD